MSLGLEAIRKKIRNEPLDDFLIDRYVALLADLSDEERCLHSLELADQLAVSNSKKSLELAQGVFDTDSKSARALEIMITAMEALGRFGRAEVLRIELDKLLGRPSSSDDEGPVNLGFLKNTPALDLNQTPALDLEVKHEKPPRMEFTAASIPPKNEPNAVLPAMEPKPAAVAELFDYYWMQGLIQEGRKLLDQSATFASHQPWWKERKALLEQLPVEFRPSEKNPNPLPVPEKNQPAAMPVVSMKNLVQEFQLDRFLEKIQARNDNSEFAAANMPTAVLDELIAKLLSLKNEEKFLDLAWDVVQGLWREQPNLDTLAFLTRLELTHVSPKFWSVSLLALMKHISARAAWNEITQVLRDKQPYLTWARVAAQHLPEITRSLGMHPLDWREDDGVPALNALLRRPPRYQLWLAAVA